MWFMECPARCPSCLGGKVQITTTDATDYAWFAWGRNPGAQQAIQANRWEILPESVAD